jgi:hypothetical protein
VFLRLALTFVSAFNAPMGTTIELGPGVEEPFETGAKFFAALAFPAATEVAARHKAVEAMYAIGLRMTNKAERCELPFSIARLNEYVSVGPAQANAAFRKLKRRIRDRFHAARAARPILHPLIAGGPHPPVEGIKQFTSQQIAEWVGEQGGPDWHNFLKRVCRPSRPVLHLAVAADEMLLRSGVPEGKIPLDTQEITVFRALVLRAAALEEPIATERRLRVIRNTQLTLRWVE